uniref:Uncharacterized protein n=1 Tax=Sphaerodactylus townsendi TaxID=933632 RepID=A0ACB8FS75_9SAUR
MKRLSRWGTGPSTYISSQDNRVSTSEFSNSLEDDVTQIPMSQMSGASRCRVKLLQTSHRAMVVEQGEAEAMERRRFKEKREREVSSFMQSRAEHNSELSSLRLAIDRGNDIMQTLVTALLQHMGAAGSWGASAPEVASHTLPAPAVAQCRATCATAGPSADHRGDAAELNYPTLTEDTEPESRGSDVLPSEVGGPCDVLGTVLCGTQGDCRNHSHRNTQYWEGRVMAWPQGQAVTAATFRFSAAICVRVVVVRQ